jgi:hypothetical protein
MKNVSQDTRSPGGSRFETYTRRIRIRCANQSTAIFSIKWRWTNISKRVINIWIIIFSDNDSELNALQGLICFQKSLTSNRLCCEGLSSRVSFTQTESWNGGQGSGCQLLYESLKINLFSMKRSVDTSPFQIHIKATKIRYPLLHAQVNSGLSMRAWHIQGTLRLSLY